LQTSRDGPSRLSQLLFPRGMEGAQPRLGRRTLLSTTDPVLLEASSLQLGSQEGPDAADSGVSICSWFISSPSLQPCAEYHTIGAPYGVSMPGKYFLSGLGAQYPPPFSLTRRERIS
jgi:hypothetical protein